jgi:hypothetical protein
MWIGFWPNWTGLPAFLTNQIEFQKKSTELSSKLAGNWFLQSALCKHRSNQNSSEFWWISPNFTWNSTAGSATSPDEFQTLGPTRCLVVVMGYVEGDRYASDFAVVAADSLAFASQAIAAAKEGDAKPAWVFDVDKTLLCN